MVAQLIRSANRSSSAAEYPSESESLDLFQPTTPLGFAGNDTNLFRYVGNGPTLFIDPSGLMKVKGNNYGDWDFTQTNADLGKSTDPKLKPFALSRIRLIFEPNKNCNCDQIAFIQAGKIAGIDGRAYTETRDNVKNRLTKDDWAIDRPKNNKYGWASLRNDDTFFNVIPGNSDGMGNFTNAEFNDMPRTNDTRLRFELESAVACRKGKDANKVYASFTWGFEVDKNGVVTSLPFAHHDSPSQQFMDAVAAWNAQANGPKDKRNDPDQQRFGPLTISK